MAVKVRQIIKKEIEVPNLGQAIKKAREDSGRSVKSVASDIGVSRNYWHQIESEAVLGGISLDTLRKIEFTLNVNFGVNFDD